MVNIIKIVFKNYDGGGNGGNGDDNPDEKKYQFIMMKNI